MTKATKYFQCIIFSVLCACNTVTFAAQPIKTSPSQQPLISFNEIKKEFRQDKAWGVLTSIDLHDCDPKKVRSEADIKQYVKELCELIGAKRFGETVVVNFGEDERIAGFSMTQLIETSLISGHFVNAKNYIYMDVFSCKPYDPAVVIAFTKKFFGAKETSANVIMRR